MQVRLLRPDEHFEAGRISMIAFHMRYDNPEEKRASCEEITEEDWGAFTDDGHLMAHIINNKLTVFLNGHTVPCGGIGGVSTLPEYRGKGAVRAIFRQLLAAAHTNGEVISALYPFNHAFYRKFGYETVCTGIAYELRTEILRGCRFDGEAVQYQPEGDAAPYLDVYQRFASDYNLCAVRDEQMMREHLKGQYFKDRRFIYMLRKYGRNVAYVAFQDVYNQPQAKLQVEDIAWDGREGFRAVLGFLARFTADYGSVSMTLPMGVSLHHLLATDDLYGVSSRIVCSYMVRVVDTEKLLNCLKVPKNCSFVIRVRDEMIEDNNGTWLVDDSGAVPAFDHADLTVNVRALAQMATGAITLDEAALRDDVEIDGNEEVLRSVFVRRPLYIAEQF